LCGADRGADRNDGVSSIDGQRTMVVRLVGARARHFVDRPRVGMRMLPGGVLVRVAAVDQFPMLGASRVLDQEHVASARALQE